MDRCRRNRSDPDLSKFFKGPPSDREWHTLEESFRIRAFQQWILKPGESCNESKVPMVSTELAKAAPNDRERFDTVAI